MSWSANVLEQTQQWTRAPQGTALLDYTSPHLTKAPVLATWLYLSVPWFLHMSPVFCSQ